MILGGIGYFSLEIFGKNNPLLGLFKAFFQQVAA